MFLTKRYPFLTATLKSTLRYMSVENLNKELDAIHERIRAEQDLNQQVALMAERDKLMHQLVQAQQESAAYYHQKARELEEGARPKTIQMPNRG